MKHTKWLWQLIVPVMLCLTVAVSAQEAATISKARLAELERQAAEAEKLKADLAAARAEIARLKKQGEQQPVSISAPPPAEPKITRVAPPMASLPPLNQGEVVQAFDLAEHYRADAAVADQRYRRRRLRVQGEVVAFEKPMFISSYNVILKTADGERRVVCSVDPPPEYTTAFTIKNGQQMVGVTKSGARIPLVKVGETIVVEGWCKGASDSVVKLAGCELKGEH